MEADEEAAFAAYYDYQESEDRRWTRLLIARATFHPGRIDTDYYPERWWRRLAYLVKGWACVMLGWRPDYRAVGDYPDKCELAYDQVDTYGGYDLTILEVGRGLLSGWWYRIEHDGEWMI